MSDNTLFESMEDITEFARKNATKVITILVVVILILIVIYYIYKYYTREKMADLVNGPNCGENNLAMNSLNSDSPEIQTEYVPGEDIIETFYTPVPFNEDELLTNSLSN